MLQQSRHSTEYNKDIIKIDMTCSQYTGKYENELFHDSNGTFTFSKPNGKVDASKRKIVYQGNFVMGKLDGNGSYSWYKRHTVSKDNHTVASPAISLESKISENPETTIEIAMTSTTSIKAVNSANTNNEKVANTTDNSNIISTYYQGEVSQSLRHGYGEHITKDGRIYKGYWRSGKRHGYGIQSYNRNSNIVLPAPLDPSEVKNEGSSNDNETTSTANGTKTLSHLKCDDILSITATTALTTASSRYQGVWEGDHRQGYGVMTYPTGNKYYGLWMNNQQNGVGLLHWIHSNNHLSDTNNQIYYGTFFNNQPHGYGELIWLDANSSMTRTATSSVPSLLNGFHSPTSSTSSFTAIVNNPLIKASSNIYRGQFQYGMRQGYGSFFYANSRCVLNRWPLLP